MGERRPERDRALKRTEFSSRGENPDQIERIWRELPLSGALRAEKRHVPREIIAFSRL
jgi:hypothetical protein